ncbi:MAG: colanic acid biosynthesis glycosyltransferase WcaL [Thiotrichaceae bacterium IS1]|nr:MAG: colanic acid biosynthesis glycosyltransferase WcaL [Thiotrichaceae bacterium IS1]
MNKKLAVIHSTPTWLPQTQTWMYNQVRYLPETIEPHIVCEHTENLEQFKVPNIHCFSEEVSKLHYYWDKGLRKLRLRRHLGFLVDSAKAINAQIIHSHFGNFAWTNLDAIKKLGIKHVVTFYGVDVNKLPVSYPIWRTRYAQLFREVDGILCEGSHMAKCIVNLGCPEQKVHVQHLGVSIDEIKYVPRTWNSQEPLRVLISASFVEKKGIPYALEALGQLQKDVPLEITIIGDAPKGNKAGREEKKRILAVIEKYHLQSKVRMLGYQPHSVLFREAYQHHIFLSPSVTAKNGDTEGGAPVTIIEMAATGMPIVSTRHCDISEVVQDGVTGLLAEERDVEGLVKHLSWLVGNSNKWQVMLDAGRRRVEEEYDGIRQGQRLADIYEGIK